MPALTTCAQPGCPVAVPTGRCAEHRSARERARGSSTARGYGVEHRELAAKYQRAMNEGARYVCWRCRRPLPGTRRGRDWVLGHCDADRSRYHGPEHPACDYATAGRDPEACPHRSHALPGPPAGGGGDPSARRGA